MKGYAQNLALMEPGDPNILYDPNYTALAYRGRNLRFARLRTGLDKLIADTWSRLLSLTGNTKIRVEIADSMSEDLRCTDVGFSFIDQIRTYPQTLPLLSEMSKNPGTSLLRPNGCTDDGVKFEVDPGASQEFFHTIKPIMEAISFLIHFTGSGPLRLSEVVDDRYRNGSSPRNLLISHGLVFLLRRNIKTSSSKGHRSSIIHFPPPKVAELVTYYLAVIRPVEVFLTASLGWTEQLAAYSEFLHVVKGRRLAPHQLSDIVARYTDRYFGCRLGGLDARHVIISLQAVFLPPILDPSVQKFRDTQAAHSTLVANRVYAQRVDALVGVDADRFALSHHWCRTLHSFFGLGPEGLSVRPIPFLHAPPQPTWWSPTDYIPPQPPSYQETMAQMRLMVNSALSDATDEIGARCEKVLKECYFRAAASSITLAPGLPFVAQPLLPTPEHTQPLPPTSNDIQMLPPTPDDVQVLPPAPDDVQMLPPTSDAIQMLPPTPDCVSFQCSRTFQPSHPFSQSQLEHDPRRPTSAPSELGDDVLLHILSLYTKRPGSTFTCENQRLLLDAALTCKHESTIAVLPTGSGKSIAIFGPIFAEREGISVVITCYTALRRQLAEQARSFGIKHLVWKDRHSSGSPNPTSVRLVIMITDDVVGRDARE